MKIQTWVGIKIQYVYYNIFDAEFQYNSTRLRLQNTNFFK